MNKYDQYILACVNRVGYTVGRELNSQLQEQFGISSLYARKTIQRAVEAGIIYSSSPVTFGNGQYAYLSMNYHLNKEVVMKISRVYRPAIYRILSVMDLNGGIISYYESMKVSGAPLNKEKTKTDSLDKIIKELEILNLVNIISDSKGVKYLINPSLIDNSDKYTADHFFRMRTDSMFVQDILRALINFNIIDNVKILYRNKNTPSVGVSHNNFLWDVIAYTKTTGINLIKAVDANSIDKQTMVVIDIVIHRPYTDHDFQGFYSRIQSVLNSVKDGKRKVLPIIIYAEIETKKLYHTIHKLGFLTFDLGTIFGSKIYDIIKNVNELKIDKLMSNDSIHISNVVEETLATIKSSGQEVNLRNIRGDLFEFLIYSILPSIFGNSSIQHGPILKSNGEFYEYDFIITSPHLKEITVIEAKGFMSNAKIPLGNIETKNTTSWFFGKTFPFAKKMLKSELYPNVSACYITSAGFIDDAIETMEQLNRGNMKPSKIDTWYDRNKLMSLLDQNGQSKVKDIIEKYYLAEVEIPTS
jgi:hypothetical protein